jgi:hypothetical protein
MNSFGIRGVIEGFYGKPWSHEERIDMLDFLARTKLDTYFLAPKDEPGHRRSWQELRPNTEINKLKELGADLDINEVSNNYEIKKYYPPFLLEGKKMILKLFVVLYILYL